MSHVGKLVRDVWPLLGFHAAMLAAIAATVGVDPGDGRVHAALLLFLLPGWCCAPRLLRAQDGVITRYAAATLWSLTMHMLFVAVGSAARCSFSAYFAAYGVWIAVAVFDRWRALRVAAPPRTRCRWTELGLLAVLLLFLSAGWRTPFSNDVPQFVPQQIDMAVARRLTPSDIGATALGLPEAMPRWQTHGWHVLFSLLSDLTGLSIEGLLYHWCPIPIAAWAILMLVAAVSELCGGRLSLDCALLAILGPATLWFRHHNAYVYAYRLTNNLCLDKDFALFWQLPAFAWLFVRAVRDARRFEAVLLILATPLWCKLHPMTPTYLLLQLPFLAVLSLQWNRRGVLRDLLGAAYVVGLFAATLVFGGAQSAHREIEALAQRDARQHLLTGRPLHYWIGQYAAVPELDLDLLTTEWRDGRFRLRPAVLTDCSALVGFPLALAAAVLLAGLRPRSEGPPRAVALLLACGAALGVVMVVYLAAPWFLQRAPYLYRGYERLHWCGYLPAVVTYATLFRQCARWAESLAMQAGMRRRVRRVVVAIGPLFVGGHLLEQTTQVLRREPTSLARVRGLNSVWDHLAVLKYYWFAESNARWSLSEPQLPIRPEFLRPDDRVLPLVVMAPLPYWELKQAVWWPENYGEGQALATFGPDWLHNWQAYYDCVDQLHDPALATWLADHGVTVVRDPRPGAAEYLQELLSTRGGQCHAVADGVWRLTWAGSVSTESQP